MVEPTRLKNMLVKLDHFPRDRGENNKYLKPPPIEIHRLFSPLIFRGPIRHPGWNPGCPNFLPYIRSMAPSNCSFASCRRLKKKRVCFRASGPDPKKVTGPNPQGTWGKTRDPRCWNILIYKHPIGIKRDWYIYMNG